MNKLNVVASQLKAKLVTNEKITDEDVKEAYRIAGATGRVDDKVLYVHLKRKANEQVDEEDAE